MSLAFDRSRWFSFAKASDTPCRELLSTNRCRIHRQRGERGLAGCINYECYGAGQRVSQELFAGQSWRSSPHLAPAMFNAFRALRDVHELRMLLREAAYLGLDASREAERTTLLASLEPTKGWSAETLHSFDGGSAGRKVRAFLRSLQDCLSGSRERRRRLPIAR